MSVPRVAVLAYHRIGPPPPQSWETWFSIGEGTFVEQLTTIAESGWSVIDHDTFVGALDDPPSLSHDSVLITFDDGYRSLMGVARSRLVEFGFPAVLFVPTQWVAGDNRWDLGTAEPSEALCDWDELRELQTSGFSIQSHAVTHTAMSQLSPEETLTEVDASRRSIEAALGTRVTTFAYPYGDVGREHTVAGLKRSGYRAAFRYEGGVMTWPPPDPYRLDRLPMGAETDLAAVLTG